MRITSIGIKSYAGISKLEAQVPEHGFVIKGGNGKGKSSVLNALMAALAGRGIDATAVHNGDDVAEVRVDLMAGTIPHTVRRRITTDGTTSLAVTVGEMSAKKPAAFLANLLGATLDPLELATVDAKKRKALVLAALPVTVTLEQLQAWVPGVKDVDTSGHGLEVVERLRKSFYEQRTETNKLVRAAETSAKLACAEAAELAAKVPEDAPDVVTASDRVNAARDLLARIHAQDAEATRAVERGKATRERIEAFKAMAEKARADAEAKRPPNGSLETAVQNADLATAHVQELESALADARKNRDGLRRELEAITETWNQVDCISAMAMENDRRAAELEETLASVAVAPVARATLDAARSAIVDAEAGLAAAQAAKAAAEARTRAKAATFALEDANAKAARLDAAVHALTVTAPQALIDGSAGIPGLSIVDDDVALDGVRWASLATSERMKLGLDIARRVSKCSIYFVDNFESIDEDQREQFVKLATANDGQLFVAQVTRGAVQLVAIEAGETEAAAE